jgi:hypothetical protein
VDIQYPDYSTVTGQSNIRTKQEGGQNSISELKYVRISAFSGYRASVYRTLTVVYFLVVHLLLNAIKPGPVFQLRLIIHHSTTGHFLAIPKQYPSGI